MVKGRWCWAGLAAATLVGLSGILSVAGVKLKCTFLHTSKAECNGYWEWIYGNGGHCHWHDGGPIDCHKADEKVPTKCFQCCKPCGELKEHDCVELQRPIFQPIPRLRWNHNEFWFRQCRNPNDPKCHHALCDNGKQISKENQCDCGWGGRGHTTTRVVKTIGTHCECDQIPARCCDKQTDGVVKRQKDYDYVDPAKPFCQKLLSPASDRSAWTKPFTGFDEKNRWVDRWHLDIYCNMIPTPGNGITPGGVPAGPKTYRTMTSISGVEHGVHVPVEIHTNERKDFCQYNKAHQVKEKGVLKTPVVPGGGDWSNYTNRLQFTDNTIAQEGMSFCLIGTHYRRSSYANWAPLIGFLPLAEKSFDIGNHIDPDDSRKMNTFNTPPPWELRGAHGSTDSVWTKENLIPDHYFENVWMGVLPVAQRPDNGGGVSIDPVPLSHGFEKRPAHPEWQPDPSCENPYKVSVTTIESDGIHLKNYLHIKVYAEPVSQPFKKRCPTGRIKYLMLEVRDEHGLPVGQFTDDVPCDQDETMTESVLTCPDLAKPCKSYTGTKFNYVPCMFSHPKNNVHPNIFMYTAVKGRPKKTKSRGDTCRDHYKPKDQRNPPNTKYKANPDDYVTEVHATWRFAQMDDGMVSELHFATMIIEDETPVQYYTSRLTHWDGVSETKACVAAHEYQQNNCENPIRWENRRREKEQGKPYDCTTDPRYPKQCCWGSYLKGDWMCDFRYWKREEDGYGTIPPWCYDYHLQDNPRPPPTNCNWCQFKKMRDCCWSYEWGRNYRPGRLQLGLINSCVNETYNTNRPYGYSAQYQVLKPTALTRGGWDLFRSPFVEPRSVNCHVQINFDAEKQELLYRLSDDKNRNKLGVLPLRETLKRWLDHEYRLINNSYDYPGEFFTPPFKERLYDNGERYYEGPENTVRQQKDIHNIHQKHYYNNPVPWFEKYRDVHNGEESKGRLKSREGVYELGDWHTIGMTRYTHAPEELTKKKYDYKRHIYLAQTPEDAAKKMFDSAHQDPITLKTEFCDQEFREFFGSRYILTAEERLGQPVRGREEDRYLLELKTKPEGNDLNFTMKEMALDKRNRCPCPFVATSEPPELQTKAPREREARKLHFISMMIGWVVLVPLGMFVARYFKETYSRVFFLQEFWWFAIHVMCLFTALLFTLGGIWVLRYDRMRSEEKYVYVWTDATIVHVGFGYTLTATFTLHLMFGWFRFLDYHMRIYQIAFHWLFGWLEYILAVGCIMSSGAIPDGVFNCHVFGIYCCMLVFQAVFTIGMEIHMRTIDRMLNLDPPRAYLPPPMMRVFHKDAPRSKFRVAVLILYFLGLVQFYAYLHMTMRYSKDPDTSCFQEVDTWNTTETADAVPT